jgi:RHS repeat-associated protein
MNALHNLFAPSAKHLRRYLVRACLNSFCEEPRRVAALAAFVCAAASASTANADVACEAHKTVDCGVFLAWDGVVLDNITIKVAPGVPPGRYSAGLIATNSAWLEGTYEMVVVNVNPDGTSSGSLSPNAGVSYGNGVNGWRFYYVTVGATPVTVTGDLPFLAGFPCDGNSFGNTAHGRIDITIGDPKVAVGVVSRHLKKNDLKSGGNVCPVPPPMARYSVHSMLVSLNIEDRPLRYTPAYGPSVDFTVTYNQRESQQPDTFTYSNLGPKWTFDWLSFITDDPINQLPSTNLYRAGGGSEIFAYDSGSQSFVPDPQSHAVLVKTGAATYERRLPDGSREIFALSDGATSYPRRIFMTKMVDPFGNALTVGYDASFRVTTITDALNQVTTLSYELPGGPLKITKVTDPFGRFAKFEYNDGQLTKITDEIGIQSEFTYTPGTSSIDSLTTPYGTTTFVTGQDGTNRWIQMTDPLGGKERVEYRDEASGISGTEPVAPNAPGVTNAGLNVANTFYWDKKAMQVAPGDYTKAKITHWLYDADGSLSGVVSSEKPALENRIWYTYAGQPDYEHAGHTANPSQIAQVLGDGTTQLSQFEYNSLGKTTKTIDPVGRVMSYVYDTNNVDLLEIRQTRGTNNELLRKFTYDDRHQTLTDTDAAGQVATFSYNAQGQILTSKNAKSETTTYAYGGAVPAGCLASIASPPFNGNSAVTTFAYDSFKRVRTVTDSDNYTVAIDYDNIDRKTKVTYPDATYEQFQYTDRLTGAMTLNLTGTRDRRGLWTYRHYNANEQIDSITDPENRTTQYGYCTCGALTSITDPKNQATLFNRDLQSRVYQKVFRDGTTIDYLYEGQSAPNTAGATGRLQSTTDAKNQRTNYVYFADDNIKQISYTSIGGDPLSPLTPSVSYTYDPDYNRVVTMVDGIGTTTYGYIPLAGPPALGAGQLASIDGPLGNDTITLGYDQLGRVTNRSINGRANGQTWTFDSLGRVSTEANELGIFTNSYEGVTNRLSKVAYPGGASANYGYFPNAQDKRLQQIKNLNSDKHAKKQLISQLDYTYDAEGQITSWSRNLPDLPVILRSDFSYDNADQLVSAPLKNASTNALLIPYSYAYDFAGNRTSETVGTTTTASTPNGVNQITSQSGGVNRTLSYDVNGNITSDGGTRTFEWDAANRLVAINYTGQTTRSEFTYDGLSRVAKIVEKSGTTVNSIRKFVWCGEQKCEFRDGNDAVTMRLYPQGQHNVTTAYFFTRDRLGSIREMFTGGGTIVARYEYDPYGRSTTVLGTTPTDFNFTGLYRHSKSNLDLAMYRAYDPELGRWLNRDPIGESGGLNLYAYGSNGPVVSVDPLGLDSLRFTPTGASLAVSNPQMRQTDTMGHVINGQLAWVDDDGRVLGTWRANTGGYGGGGSPLTGEERGARPGDYIVDNYRPNRGGLFALDGVGFTFDLTSVDGRDPRADLRIHPDGGEEGTHGCVALREPGFTLKDFEMRLANYIKRHRSIRLRVLPR